MFENKRQETFQFTFNGIIKHTILYIFPIQKAQQKIDKQKQGDKKVPRKK